MNYNKQNNNSSNYLSVILLLGLLLEKLPLKALQPFLNKAMQVMHSKHSAFFQRMENTNYDFIIDAYDLPFLFYMQVNNEKPILKALKRTENINTTAKIKGSLTNLLNIFEGTVDGDANFFSGKLIIEGSTAAVVQLRNALDSEEINIIEDLSEICYPFNKLFVISLNKIIKTHNVWQNKLDIVVNAINSSVVQNINEQQTIISKMQTEISNLSDIIQQYKQINLRKKSDYNAT